MPLLTPNTPPAPPAPQVPSAEQLERRAVQQVRQIKNKTLRLVDQLSSQWAEAFDALWVSQHDGDVAARLAALGTDAEELMTRNTALVTFMLTQLTGEDQDKVDFINAKLATIPAFTVANDGSVTLD